MYIIGIDIGKNHHEASIVAPKGNKSDIRFVLQLHTKVLILL